MKPNRGNKIDKEIYKLEDNNTIGNFGICITVSLTILYNNNKDIKTISISNAYISTEPKVTGGPRIIPEKIVITIIFLCLILFILLYILLNFHL